MYLDEVTQAERYFWYLRQGTTKCVLFRLGTKASLIAALKTLANKRDVPYQLLVKIFLAEKVKEETSAQHFQSDSN